jgi:hypothetical protein
MGDGGGTTPSSGRSRPKGRGAPGNAPTTGAQLASRRQQARFGIPKMHLLSKAQ